MKLRLAVLALGVVLAGPQASAAPARAAAAPAGAPAKAAASANAIHVIAPYRRHGTWVFDDARRGLVREAFVAGADDWMEAMAAGVPGGRSRGVVLVFSAREFPGAQRRRAFRRAEHGGAWCWDGVMQHEGWLCGALFDYFRAPPREIWVQVKPRG